VGSAQRNISVLRAVEQLRRSKSRAAVPNIASCALLRRLCLFMKSGQLFE
jgi:hypothetical protein